MDCLNHVGHRPYSMPEGRPAWRQSWLDLAFFHWRVPRELIDPNLPEGLELDLFEGEAWVSVVPFRMEGVMLRGLPNIPRVSDFPELNLRTYVKKDGKAGVWFYSLDADQRLAVWAAKRFFYLPYFKANMKCLSKCDTIEYASERELDNARFEAVYRPIGNVFHAQEGTLEYFLSERYCLYSFDGKQLYRGEIHHKPWQLQNMDYDITINTLGERYRFDFGADPEVAHFSKAIEVAVWNLERC